jgi:hypothetical protein
MKILSSHNYLILRKQHVRPDISARLGSLADPGRKRAGLGTVSPTRAAGNASAPAQAREEKVNLPAVSSR